MSTPYRLTEPKGPLPPVDHVFKLAIQGNVSGTPIVSIFHGQYTGPLASSGDLSSVASHIYNSWWSTIGSNCSSAVTWTGAVITDLSSTSAATGSAYSSHPGTGATPAAVNSNALVISWATNLRYRGGKPRTYLSGLPQTAIADSQHWTSTVASSVLASATTFHGSFATAPVGAIATVVHVCVHYYKHYAILATPIVEPVIGAQVATAIRSMRRRLIHA